MRLILFAFLLLNGWGCHIVVKDVTLPLKDDETVCPEYRNMRCLTAPECSMHVQRGCRVCQCQRPEGNGRPPDTRQP